MKAAGAVPRLLLALAVLTATAAGAAQSDNYLPPIGGGGGGAFYGACNSSDLLTGFQLRIIDGAQGSVPGVGSLAGLSGYLDALRPLCTSTTLAGTWGRIEAGQESRWRDLGFSGGAGTVSNNVQLVNRLCPADKPFVTGIKVNYGKRSGFVVVYDVRLDCAATAAGQSDVAVLAARPAYTVSATRQRASRQGGAAAERQQAEQAQLAALFGTEKSQSCDRGEVATGAHGRSGALVDAVGLVCGIRVLPQPRPASAIVVRSEVASANTTAMSAFGAPAARPPAALPIDAAHPAIIYGIGADGVLRWYRHNGATTGAGANVPGAWAGAKNVSADWGAFKQVFTGGKGVIYGITPEGKLIWSRHAAFLTGQASDEPGAWEESREVSGDWGNYRKVFSGGEGVIYAITTDGELLWFRHLGFADGTPGWEGPTPVASGWGGYDLVFSGGRGVIYAAGADGILKWNKHEGFESGAAEWLGPRDVGRGWNGLRTAFSAGGGIIYSIAADGILRWYRHNGYLDGRGLETPGSWEARTDVGNGWNSFTSVVAQF